MKRNDLHEKFIEALSLKIPKKHDLVSAVADALNIERESASRRLNGKVLFTAREIGILAQTLGISLDGLLINSQNYITIPFKINSPLKLESFDVLVDQLENQLKLNAEIHSEPAEVGAIFDSLPLEFAISHPSLIKFVAFNWGHYYVGTDEFNNFSLWTYPERMKKFNENLVKIAKSYESVFYVWNVSAIWNLVKEINHFRDMHILSKDDVDLLKTDLHNMLHNIENVVKGIKEDDYISSKLNLYISNLNIGIHGYYHISENNSFCYLRNYFMESDLSYDPEICKRVSNWVNSMKKVSTLISGSGAKDRKLFFEEQHNIVDSLLG